MAGNTNAPAKDPRKVWVPPPRPEWMKRINEEGDCMDIRGVVPLDSKSMIDAAIRSTGFSDFGVDDWREPFEVLCQAFDEDADLTLMGRIKARSDLLLLLKNRLQIEATYKQHPEIDDEEIVRPLMIIGQGRSGTSFLHNLLSASPENGNVMTWEAMFSCPPPETKTYTTDPRIEKAHKLATYWNRAAPELISMHEYSGYMVHGHRRGAALLRLHGEGRPRAGLPLSQADIETAAMEEPEEAVGAEEQRLAGRPADHPQGVSRRLHRLAASRPDQVGRVNRQPDRDDAVGEHGSPLQGRVA
jgi:hypothetical protein